MLYYCVCVSFPHTFKTYQKYWKAIIIFEKSIYSKHYIYKRPGSNIWKLYLYVFLSCSIIKWNRFLYNLICHLGKKSLYPCWLLTVLSKDANVCAIWLSQNKNIFPQCLLTNRIFKNKISIKIIKFFYHSIKQKNVVNYFNISIFFIHHVEKNVLHNIKVYLKVS